jgi:hypothetical protein
VLQGSHYLKNTKSYTEGVAPVVNNNIFVCFKKIKKGETAMFRVKGGNDR